MSVSPVLGSSYGVEGKMSTTPYAATTKKIPAIVKILSSKVSAWCPPIAFEGKLTHEQLKSIGEEALPSPEKMKKLWDLVMHSKVRETYTEKIGLIASRAITALNLVKFSFSGKDLSGVNIPNANLSGGIFYKTKFIGAKLRGVKWQQAFLGNALLQRSDLREADFGQFSLKGPNVTCREACSLTVQGPLVAIGEAGGQFRGESPKIHVWPMADRRAWHMHSWEQRVPVVSVAITVDRAYLVSAGGDGHVTVWNLNTKAVLHKLSPGYLLKREIISEFSQQLWLRMKDLYLLTPPRFHFILKAIEPVVKSIQARTPVDPASLARLRQVVSIEVSPRQILVSGFLDVKLRAVIKRLLQIVNPAAARRDPDEPSIDLVSLLRMQRFISASRPVADDGQFRTMLLQAMFANLLEEADGAGVDETGEDEDDSD